MRWARLCAIRPVALAVFCLSNLCLAQPLTSNIELVTPDVTRVVRLGTEERAWLRLRGPIEGKLVYEIEAFSGKTYRDSVDVVLEPGQVRRIALPSSLFEQSGIRWVRAKLEQGENTLLCFYGAFACIRPARDIRSYKDGDFIFGIAYGAGPDNLSPIAARKSSLVGITMLRSNPRWSWVQPQKDHWDWSRVDELVRIHDREGIRLQALVFGTPRWAVVRNDTATAAYSQTNPPDLHAWKVWVRKLAEHLKGKVKYWEIWNEPDIDFFTGTQEQYFAMLRAAYKEIKAVDPNAVVMTGGFVSMVHHGRKPFMIERCLADHCAFFDMIAYHAHGPFDFFREELDERLLPYCKKVLPEERPLYFTETGMDTRFGQRYQAITLPKKIVFAWSRGAVAYTWFSLHDHPSVDSPTKPGFTYGLFTAFRQKDPTKGWSWDNIDYECSFPKASYVAMNTVTSVLHGARFVRQLDLGPQRFIFEFKGRDHNAILVMWHESDKDDNFEIAVQSEKDLQLVDLMGNIKPVTLQDGKATVTVGAEPVFLCAAPGASIRFLKARGEGTEPFKRRTLIIAEGNLPPKPQLKLNNIAQVVNLYEHDPHNAHLLWQGPEDLSADVRIARDEKRILFEISVRDDLFDWASAEQNERDRVELAVRPAGGDGYWIIVVSGDPRRRSGSEALTVAVKPLAGASAVGPNAVSVSGLLSNHHVTYRVSLDRAAFSLGTAFELNLAVWDADGKGIGGWLEAAEGMRDLRGGTSQPDMWIVAQ